MSDLLIKNLALPGAGKPYLLHVASNGKVYVMVADEPDWSETWAVSIPPHGRLGDLDALAQQIEHERFHHTHTDGLAARHHVAEYGHFLKAISDAPTIIPGNMGSEQW